MTDVTGGLRSRSARKRADILDAARELFVSDGYERTSVDAISTRARVSKRTVYDYFGDKQTIFRSVVETETAALSATVRSAVAEELTDDAPLDQALLSFARRVTTEALSSSHYSVLRRLQSSAQVGVLTPTEPDEVPELILAARLAAYARAGRLSVDKPRRAAEHFSALTFLLALDLVGDTAAVDEMLVDGVAAFLRAYVPR